MATLIQLAPGDWIDPAAVEIVTIGEWTRADGLVSPWRTIVGFKSGSQFSYAVDTKLQATTQRDEIANQVLTALKAAP